MGVNRKMFSLPDKFLARKYENLVMFAFCLILLSLCNIRG